MCLNSGHNATQAKRCDRFPIVLCIVLWQYDSIGSCPYSLLVLYMQCHSPLVLMILTVVSGIHTVGSSGSER